LRIPEKKIHRSISWESIEIKNTSIKIALESKNRNLLKFFCGAVIPARSTFSSKLICEIYLFIKVDFPAALSPTRPTISPGITSKFTFEGVILYRTVLEDICPQ
jgi:hypothetical protein